MTGRIFDVKEFALNDGSGIRTTVFFKGCPLRCQWCHNPEGQSFEQELYVRQNGCLHCGHCRKGCDHPECRPFGRCLHICPKNLVRVTGEDVTSEALAQRLLRRGDVWGETGGGVTLSGGEPLAQSDFAADLLEKLKGRAHTAIETSGFASEEDFRRVTSLCDFVYMDVKLIDGEEHKRWTGVDNAPILKNAGWLKTSGIPHCFRTPLIPGITDTKENLEAIGAFVGNDAWERLPYNTLAGAKYEGLGRTYPLSRLEPNETLPKG